MKTPTLCIIGAGRAGGSLARLWRSEGSFELLGLHTRSGNAKLANALCTTEFSLHHLPDSDATLIATGDQAIGEIARSLAQQSARDWRGKLVFHLSGALTCQVLAPLAERGAHIASAHPVRAFSSDQTALADTWIGIEGDDKALPRIKSAFASIGGRCFSIDGEHKTKYHAAAVLASNHLLALAHASTQLWHEAGVDPSTASALYDSLTRGVLDNLTNHRPTAALTGPIARGDAETVQAHLHVIDSSSAESAALYRQLSHYLIDQLVNHDQALKEELLAALKPQNQP